MPSAAVRRFRERRGVRVFGLVAAIGVLVALGGFALEPDHARGHAGPTPAATAARDTVPIPPERAHRPRVSAIVGENDRPGTTTWRIQPYPAFGIAGYADRVSVQRGEAFALYVTTFSTTFRVEAYRMGWYHGAGGRLVWRSPLEPGRLQSKRLLSDHDRTVSTKWVPSLHIRVPASWVPGDYLLKLVIGRGASYVPLTVRDDSSHAAVLVVNAVTSWQAYNDYGGYSLYHGTNASPASRSTIVSFDRPYARDGAGDFIANELGLVALAERIGLDVTYITNVDLHAQPQLLLHHKVIVSLGHDEYWSAAMRTGVEAARDRGVNVMFLGANALFRRIRLEPSPLGANRLEVNYRGTAGDLEYRRTHREPTSEWRAGPQARPESSLTGTYYECNPVNVDGVVADAASWVFAGTGLRDGDHLHLLVGTEYDRVTPSVPTPTDIEVLLHSPLRCKGRRSFADAAYYTVRSGAGVFDAGTGAWVCKLFSGCPADVPFAADPKVQRITENILRAFAAGPVGRAHPARSNLAALGIIRRA